MSTAMIMFKKILPSLCTLANLVFGLIALLLIIDGRCDWAAVFIVAGALFDGFDGRLARALNVSSEFGKQLDSLSDLVTFGVAPAILAYVTSLSFLPAYWGAVAVLPFTLMGALRLARFNVLDDSSGFFVGVPITLAGGFLALTLLYAEYLSEWVVLAVLLTLSFLMISTFRFPDFKAMGIKRSHALATFSVLVGAVIWLRWHASAVFMFPVVVYLLVGIKNNMVDYWHNIKSKSRA